ncbi:hypothetical protein EDB60_110166 [Vibrio crassostreae]|uniref:hypothetical protein n=1 Tax=Vibrio crassostreae TaxID=246167 RepID=UPI00104E2CB1|nr:hypothetical protein [Vibrio crassostreae]TCN66975.1 hypothetical protein EDB60_110166 [Vibrio crassostreae]
MKSTLMFFITVILSASVKAGVFDATSEQYCTSYTNCTKGELIIIPSKHVISICDMNKNVVIANGKAICFYIGERRTPKKV